MVPAHGVKHETTTRIFGLLHRSWAAYFTTTSHEDVEQQLAVVVQNDADLWRPRSWW